MKRIIGVESWNAVCTPIDAWVAPGPRVTKQDAGRPGEFCRGLRHVGRARLVAADDETDRVPPLVETVEHRQVTLARHAEREVHAVADQRIDNELAAASGRHRPSAHSCRTAKPLAFSISSRPRGPAR